MQTDEVFPFLCRARRIDNQEVCDPLSIQLPLKALPIKPAPPVTIIRFIWHYPCLWDRWRIVVPLEPITLQYPRVNRAESYEGSLQLAAAIVAFGRIGFISQWYFARGRRKYPSSRSQNSSIANPAPRKSASTLLKGGMRSLLTGSPIFRCMRLRIRLP